MLSPLPINDVVWIQFLAENFRKAYFQKYKPVVKTGDGILSVQKFQTGGLSTREKLY